MKIALVGLMQSGKSTLMSTITGKEPAMMGVNSVDEAVAKVPDERFSWLIDKYQPKKITYATIDCLDMPGYNFADDSGRSMARKLMNQIRTVDMLVMVIRAFENTSVPAYGGKIDPVRDLNDLQSELLLADLELVTTRIEKLEVQVKKPTKTQKQDQEELQLQLKLQETLENEKPAATAIETDREREILKSLNLLTMKPIMVVVNVGEGDIEKQFQFTNLDSSVPVINICCDIERELSLLDDESRLEFMQDMGIKEIAAEKFMKNCYSALGLISFLTVGPDEVRAWPIRKGTIALDAAGKIHSDIKRGFIRAETIAYEDLVELGGGKAVKAAGKARLEGKEYIVKDGDIIDFRFNV